MDYDSYHETRLKHDPKRQVLWKTLCDAFFNKLIQPNFHVLDLGSGYGDFINNVRCAKRTAVDITPLLRQYAEPTVQTHIGTVTDLSFLSDNSIDFAFASNLFEHLTQDEFAKLLGQLRTKLTSGGSLNLVQPNYRFAYREYFDDYTHVAVYSDVSMCDFLAAHGFRVIDSRPRFMPFSIKSRLPVIPALIRVYLALPWKPLAKQMFIRAVPVREQSGDAPR